MSEAEKREIIKESGGAFTWKQGELSGKAVHHVVVNPFRQQDKTTVLGKAPVGAKVVSGKGESKRSLRLTKGTAPKKAVRYEGGAVDPIVSPVGKKRVRINFVRDTSVKLRSKKRGRVYHTKIGKGNVLSRRPLGKKRRQ